MATVGFVRIANLKEGPNQLEQEIPPELLDIGHVHGCELTVIGSPLVHLDLFRRHSEVYVTGQIRFRAHLICADCDCVFARDFAESVSMEFQKSVSSIPPGGHISAGNRQQQGCHELAESELARGFYQGDELELLPLIRDTILLAIPIAPLCRPDCQGICPDCGGNLNHGECHCARTGSPQGMAL